MLRTVEPGDYPYLYDMAVRPPNGLRWVLRGHVPSPEQFVANLWSGVLAQFAIETHDGELVGLVTLNNASLQDGHCYLSVLSDESVHGSGTGVEAIILLANYGFAVWNLDKIYIEVPEWNLPQFSAVDRYLELEGRLRDHVRLGRHRADLLIFAFLPRHVDLSNPHIAPAARRALGGPAVTPSGDARVRTLSEFLAAIASSPVVDTTTVDPDADLRSDLGLDSLGMLELLEDLNNRVGLDLDDSVVSAKTPADLYRAWARQQETSTSRR